MKDYVKRCFIFFVTIAYLFLFCLFINYYSDNNYKVSAMLLLISCIIFEIVFRLLPAYKFPGEIKNIKIDFIKLDELELEYKPWKAMYENYKKRIYTKITSMTKKQVIIFEVSSLNDKTISDIMQEINNFRKIPKNKIITVLSILIVVDSNNELLDNISAEIVKLRKHNIAIEMPFIILRKNSELIQCPLKYKSIFEPLYFKKYSKIFLGTLEEIGAILK